ncbi:MAG: hypothetical protein LBQ32_08515 [Burkholderiaceae bacterium]|jgi:hypothetical protein|nr:hypothetical protein [Burkholderiaceae bacterium]
MPRLDPNNFSNLNELISGWFHQDFAVERADGSLDDSMEGVLETYRRVYSDEECAAVVRDIDRFLGLPEDNLDDIFVNSFEPSGIYLPGWGISAREWLQRARELLL